MPAEFGPDIPQEWGTTLEFIAPTITDKMDQTAVVGDDWIANVSRLLPALVMADEQRRLLNVQIERARQGLPPLDMSAYAAGANVNVGVNQDTRELVKWVAIGFGAVLVFNAVSRAR